jgi:predicted transcriptional regulator
MGREDHPLRKRRRALNLRLVDVAQRAGVSTPLISMMEGGYEPSKRSTLERVARAVESTVDDIWPQETTA